jgi:hypothetical protein
MLARHVFLFQILNGKTTYFKSIQLLLAFNVFPIQILQGKTTRFKSLIHLLIARHVFLSQLLNAEKTCFKSNLESIADQACIMVRTTYEFLKGKQYV